MREIALNILAVIPARAGSKGIPNKNIRLIGDHPLVYYAIHTAQTSAFITDVVVTTDSPEVAILASRMGVRVRWREERLCGDAVTLDAVIDDAVDRSVLWDYVVTMQPTSPTLTVKTLDAAIRYTIENKYDTVISVINAPHLSWGVKDGNIVPNYQERLNRQYLPVCYKETGAFLISKASVVTEKTRIGEKVSVFEVPESEAQDVDTFSDLQCAEAILNRRKVAIYVNGNLKRGMGHIYRALEIADEFFCKPDIFYDLNQTDEKFFGRTTHTLKPVNGRFETIRSDKGWTAIVDYAHTPDAVDNVIQTIREIKKEGARLITVVGCGGNRDKGKRPMMAQIAKKGSEQLILTSDNPRDEEPKDILKDMTDGLTAEELRSTLVIEDRAVAIQTACTLAQKDDVILIAGKGHEDYQIIKGVKYHFDDHEIIKRFS